MKFIKYFCVIAFAFGINAEVIANTQKILSAAGLAVNEDIKVEFGEGIGETKDEALKEAILVMCFIFFYVLKDDRIVVDHPAQEVLPTQKEAIKDVQKIRNAGDSAGEWF